MSAVPAENCPAASMAKPAKTKWTRRKQARPTELLDAAIDLFVEKGFAATRLEDVASRAGVSKGTLYLYFENKVELFKAVVRECFNPLIEAVKSRTADHQGSIEELLRNEVFAFWNSVGSTRLSGVPKLVMAESLNFPEIGKFYFDEVIAPFWGHLQNLIQLGVARGEFRVLDSEYTAKMLFTPMLMLSTWQHSLESCSDLKIDRERYLDAYLRTIMLGLVSDGHGLRSEPGLA